jgi:hypothetical protein
MTNGLVVMTPSSIAYSGTSASINADGSVTFSACTSLSLNGVFTGDYDNYMMVFRNNASGITLIQMRLRVSGVDNSTASSYTHQYLSASGSSIARARNSDSNFKLSYGYLDNRQGTTVYFFGPYLAQPTACRTVNVWGFDSSETGLRDYAQTHNQSVSYDGLTIYPSNAETFTGLVTVFGFNQ